MTTPVLYSDVSNRIDPMDKTGVVENIDSVYQSISNFFSTRRDERFFEPQIYCDIEEFIFENANEETALALYSSIKKIEQHDPRVRLDKRLTQVTPIPEENAFRIILIFYIKGLDNDRFEYKRTLTK